MSAPPRPFRVLFVCTGNICRSAQAEVLWRTRLDPALVTVTSAGTRALVDHGMPEQAQAIARSWGVPAELAANHRAQLLDARLIADADLIIALTRDHRAEVVRTLPAATRRTVTLREAVRLVESLVDAPTVDVARLRALPVADALRELVPLALAERGVVAGPSHPEHDDVVDPYRREDEIYALSGEHILTATGGLFRAVERVAQRQG